MRSLRSRGQWFDGPVVLTDLWCIAELMRELGYPTAFVRAPQLGVDWSPVAGAYVLAHLRDWRKFRAMLLEIRDSQPDPFDLFDGRSTWNYLPA